MTGGLSTLHRAAAGLALAAALALPARAQDFSKVEIKAEQLAPNVYMMVGAGGNLGVRSARTRSS